MRVRQTYTSHSVKDDEYYRRSNENRINLPSMIAEMEAGGRKVIRRDSFGDARAVLVVPELVIAEGSDDTFYPNAVKNLYDAWKSETHAR